MAYPFEYTPNYIKDKTQYSIDELKKVLNLKQDMIQVLRHGGMEMVKEQRGTCWLADDDITFEYSGKSMIPQKIPDIIGSIKLQIERDFGIEFSGILANYYPDGNSSMGYHSDPIEDKWDNKFIVISFGDTRNFIFREIENKDTKITYEFKDGDLIYMFDDCQDRYEHSVRKKKQDGGERISLVFKKRI
jgi:alkylated DNA repair dioxygenase AlkB